VSGRAAIPVSAVPVGGPHHALHHLTRSECYPSHDRRASHKARAALHGRLSALRFLDGLGEQVWAGTNRLVLGRMTEQSPDGVRQHGRCGLQPAKDDDACRRQDLLIRELARGGDRREDRVVGLLSQSLQVRQGIGSKGVGNSAPTLAHLRIAGEVAKPRGRSR
jgi:hypothetical protein